MFSQLYQLFGVIITGTARKGISAVAENEEAVTASRHEAVPAPSSHNKLVMSGGEGYVDFRIGRNFNQYKIASLAAKKMLKRYSDQHNLT